MTFHYLETERLLLRKLTDPEYRFIFENHADAEAMHYLGLKSVEDAAAEREKFRKGFSTFNKSFVFFQILEKDTKKIIGWCGYHTWYLNHARAEMGYGLTDDDAKAKGIMSEAIAPILRYGFEEMQLNRVEALIGPDNVPSLKLVAKFGFTKEGQLRKHYFTNERFEDSVVFSLLKEEYQSAF